MFKHSSIGTEGNSELIRVRSGIVIDPKSIVHGGSLTKLICNKKGFFIGMIGGVTCLGKLPEPKRGARYELKGEFKHNIRYGEWQFHFESFQEFCDQRTGIMEYLIREAPGIGPKTAAQLAERFPENLLQVLANEPEKLQGIDLPLSKRESLSLWAQGQLSNARTKEKLYGIGLLPGQVRLILSKYGNDAERKIRQDCFGLTEIHGFGFITVAKIADLVGVPDHDPGRLRAALMYAFEILTDQGHTCISAKELIKKAQEWTTASQTLLLEQIDFLLETQKLVNKNTKLKEIAERLGLLYP
jgi:ATP-dependent exoDNAse (exonuclease V) alpha subunit